jgi:hypothetical protein
MKISGYDTQDFSWKKNDPKYQISKGEKKIPNHQNCMIISR